MTKGATFFVALLALMLGACTAGNDDSKEPNKVEDVNLTVFAAASLKSTFEELGTQFEKDNPGVTVTFNFAGSSDLVAQIQDGAPADIFASADVRNMDKAVVANVVEGEPTLFATNVLQIAIPPNNPKNIKTFVDLAKPDIKIVICAPQVPCGNATVQVAEKANVTLSPVSEELSVTDVLGKVRSSEADAGLVYVTDVIAAGDDVLGIAFPESSFVVNEYPIVALKNSKNLKVAQAFAAFIVSPEGQKVSAAAGFGQP